MLVTVSGITHLFVRDGNCIQDQNHVFGKICKGGKAGEASNVSTRTVPAPAGTWVATQPEGTFTLEFKPDNRFTLGATLVLKFLNNTYESTSFGFPMKFVKQ